MDVLSRGDPSFQGLSLFVTPQHPRTTELKTAPLQLFIHWSRNCYQDTSAVSYSRATILDCFCLPLSSTYKPTTSTHTRSSNASGDGRSLAAPLTLWRAASWLLGSLHSNITYCRWYSECQQSERLIQLIAAVYYNSWCPLCEISIWQ